MTLVINAYSAGWGGVVLTVRELAKTSKKHGSVT